MRNYGKFELPVSPLHEVQDCARFIFPPEIPSCNCPATDILSLFASTPPFTSCVFRVCVFVYPKNLQENVNRIFCLFLFTSKSQGICSPKSNKAQINIH